MGNMPALSHQQLDILPDLFRRDPVTDRDINDLDVLIP
jgi:hypothetical protein